MTPGKGQSGKSVFQHIKKENLIGGVAGGVISTALLHPLDLVKVRFQVDEGIGITNRPKYNGLWHAFVTIGRTNGLTGLYQGAVPNITGAGAAWGFYFLFYNAIKGWMQDGDLNKPLGAPKHMLAAAQSGVATLIITNPIWVVKTRLCLQYDAVASSGTHASKSDVYKGMYDALKKIYKTEGLRGWYRGFVPGLFGVSHGALQFMAYEELKRVYNKCYNKPLSTRLSSAEYLIFAAISKIFAASVTYPYQVVRSRLQDQHRSYNGATDVLRQIWSKEGVKGFYKGIVPNVLRVVPNCCVVFVVYEWVTGTLSARSEQAEKQGDM